MATVAQNNLKKKIKGLHNTYRLRGNDTINQGDVLTYVGGANNGYVRAAANDADANNCAGVALQTFPVTSLGVGDGNNKQLSMEVGWGDLFTFNTTANDTYYDGTAVYLGADAQTVTSTQDNNTANNLIGYVRKDPLAGGGVITGASGVKVDVEILRKAPSVNLS